jgi:hypothetical protein
MLCYVFAGSVIYGFCELGGLDMDAALFGIGFAFGFLDTLAPCVTFYRRHRFVTLRLPVLRQAGRPVTVDSAFTIGKELAPSCRVAVPLAVAVKAVEASRLDHVGRDQASGPDSVMEGFVHIAVLHAIRASIRRIRRFHVRQKMQVVPDRQ